MELRILNSVSVDFGKGDMAGIGGTQAAEGLHEWEVITARLVSSKNQRPQIYLKSVCVNSITGEPSLGKTNQDWQSLPFDGQDAGKKATTQGMVNRLLFAVLSTTLSGVNQLTDEWVQAAFQGQRFFAHYFPFVDAKDNEGTELSSVTTYLSRAARKVDGTTEDEVALVQQGQRTLTRPPSSRRKIGGSPGYTQAMTQLSGGAAQIPGLPGMPGSPAVPGALPGVALPTPGVGTGFVPGAGLPAVPGVAQTPAAAIPPNGGQQVAGLPPMPAVP